MRIRALLIIAATVVVAGCQAGPSTAAGPTTSTTTRTTTRTTTPPPPRTTPSPDKATPHDTVRFRLFVADENHDSVMILAPHGQNPARDARTAKQLRQNPAVATDKAAQQRAADSLDCDQDDPLVDQDDANLPLVTCTSNHDAAVLGPTLLDSGMVAGASYGLAQRPATGSVVAVDLTPAGRKVVADMAPKNVNVLLALLFDGQIESWLFVKEDLASPLEFSFQQPDDAKQVAAIINNR